MDDNDKVKVLYDAVSQDYDIGSYDEFRSKLQDPEKQKAFYNGVGKQYSLGTYDEFAGKINQSFHTPSPVNMQQLADNAKVFNPMANMPQGQPVPVKPQAPEMQLPKMKGKTNHWGAAFVDDVLTSPLAQGLGRGFAGVGAGAEKLLSTGAQAMTGVPDPFNTNENADKSEFTMATNIHNSAEDAHKVYDYLKSKGLNPNDSPSVVNYLEHNNSPNDKEALTYFGGDTWLKNQKEGEFNKEELFAGKNKLRHVGNAFSTLMQMAPQMMGGVPSFVVDGYGKTKQYLDNSNEAKSLSPTEKEAISIIGGGINALADFFHLPLGKGVIEKITPVLAKKAYQAAVEAGAGKLTSEGLAAATRDTYMSFAQKLKQGGISTLKDIAKSSAVATGLTTANQINHAAANKLAGDKVYDLSWDQYLNELATANLQFGIPHASIGLVKPAFAFLPRTQRNYFNQKVTEATSDADIQKLKDETAEQGKSMGFTPEQISSALNTVDTYAEIKRKLPEGLGHKKTNELLGLMDQRAQLKDRLRQLDDKREGKDELFKGTVDSEISTAKTNLESLEDKIQSIAFGNNFNYIEKDGSYYKVNSHGGDTVPITKDRYEFEKLMADQAKTPEERAVDTGAEGIDNIINNLQDESQKTSTAETETQPIAGQENNQERNGIPQESNTGSQEENLGNVTKAPDADGLIRNAVKSEPGTIIEVNGKRFKVLESERSTNRQSGTAKIVPLVEKDGQLSEDHDTGVIEISQKADSRNSDRMYDDQNEIKTATRLPDGRYSFGSGIRASANIDGLIEGLNTPVEKPTMAKSPQLEFPENSWSAKFNVLPEENRQPELEGEVTKAKEILKQLNTSEKVNIKTDAVLGRIKELVDNKLIDKEEANRQADEIRRYRDNKLEHLIEGGEKKSAGRSATEQAADHLETESEKITDEEGNLDVDKLASAAKTSENPEAINEILQQHSDEVGQPKQDLIDRLIEKVDNTLKEETDKRGKKNTNTYSVVIPPFIGREIGIGALRAMRGALLATKSFTEAFKAGIKHIKDNGLSGKELDEARKWLHQTFASLNAEHIKDFVKENRADRETETKLKKALSVLRARSKAYVEMADAKSKFKADTEELKAAHAEHEAALVEKNKEKIATTKERYNNLLQEAKDKHENKQKQAKYNYELAQTAIKDAVKAIKEQYKGKKLPFNQADITKLTALASGTLNLRQADKVIDELNKRFKGATNNKLITDTESLGKKVAKIISHDKTSTTEREVFRRINAIKPNDLRTNTDDIDFKAVNKLKAALQQITESHKDVNVTKDGEGGYELINEQKANHDVLHTIADELEPLQQATIDRREDKQATELLQELEDNGAIDTSGLSAAEIDQLKQSIKDGTLPELKEQRENERLADIADKIDRAENKSELLKGDVDRLQSEVLDRPELDDSTPLKRDIKQLISGSIDTSEMTNSELVRLHRVLARMAENGDITKAADLVKIAFKAKAIPEIRTLMNGRGATISKFWASLHLPHMMGKIMPNEKELGKFETSTGIQDWNSGFNLAKNEARDVSEEALRLIGRAGGQDSKSIQAGYGSLRRGVIAYLLQHYGGTTEEINEHFNNLSLKNLDQTIEYLKSSPEDKEYTKQAEMLSSIKDELLDGVTDYDSFVNKVKSDNSGDMEVIQHWIDSYAKHKKQLADTELLLKGNEIDDTIENYTSTKVSDSGERGRNEIQSLIEDYNQPATIAKKSSGATISRERMPLKNGFLNFDFDAIQPQRFMENQLQIHTLADRYKMQGLFDDPRFQQTVFPKDARSMSRFYQRIKETEQARRGANGDMNTQGGRIANKILDGLQSLASVYQLGSVTQVLKQVPSVAINTAINLGADAPLLYRGFTDRTKAEEFLKQSGVSLRHEGKVAFTSTQQAMENGTRLNKINRLIISQLNKHGAEVLPVNIRQQIMQAVMEPLGRSDQFIAEASHLAYYLKYLKNEGHDITHIDWDNEAKNPNKEALAYAEHMVDKTQNVSDKTKVATWLQPKGLYARVGQFIASPYSSFNLNQKMRSAGDFNKMLYGPDAETKLQGARDFGATVAESIVFNLIKAYGVKLIGGGMQYAYSNMMSQGHNSDDDKNEMGLITDDYKNGLHETTANTLQDIAFSGLGTFTSDAASFGMNKLYTAAAGQEPHISPTTGNVKVRDRQDMFTQLTGGQKTPMDMAKMYMGGFSPAVELITRNGERLSDLYNGYKEVTNQMTGDTKKIPLTDYEKSLTKWMVLKDAMAVGAGAQDADILNRPMEKEYTKAMNDLKLGYFDGFKRIIQAQHFHETKFALGNGKMGDTAEKVDANRDKSENSARAERLNKDYEFYQKNMGALALPLLLQQQVVASGQATKETRELFELNGKRILKAMNSGTPYVLNDEDKSKLVKAYTEATLKKSGAGITSGAEKAIEDVSKITDGMDEAERNDIIERVKGAMDEVKNKQAQQHQEQQIDNQ